MARPLDAWTKRLTRAVTAMLGSALCVYCIFNVYRVVRELRFVRGRLSTVLGRRTIESREDLVTIKNHLTEAIDTDPARRFESRPLLRSSVEETFANGFGFCGENARAAVVLLNAGGVRAQRLYLEGARWGHVVVEHEWNGAFKLFDAHRDPETLMPDELIGRLSSDEYRRLPTYEQNPWRRAYRLRLLDRWRPTRRFSALRAPRATALLAESPSRIRLAAGLAGWVPLLVGYRRLGRR